MFLEINDKLTISELQLAFAVEFPWLRIDFFETGHAPGKSSEPGEKLAPHLQVGNIRKTHRPGMMEIQPWHSARQVEDEFEQHFGLHVQISRKHGNEWIQTAGTDNLTLREQNEISRLASG